MEPLSKQPHAPAPLLGKLAWPVCRKCGLIYLKNRVTRKAIKRSCPGTPDEPKGK